MVEPAIVIVAGVVVYRLCLTVMFEPIRFWDLRKW